MDCIFCKIAAGEIPAKLLYEDELVVAFDDINPQAPHHKLIIPRKHIATLNEVLPEDNEILGHMVHAAQQLAQDLGIAKTGYRFLMNCNRDAGQTVFHVHAHLLGGKKLAGPG